MSEDLLKNIDKKMNKIVALLTIQNIQDKEDKIYALKNIGLTSLEVGNMLGLSESTIRGSKGWKRK